MTENPLALEVLDIMNREASECASSSGKERRKEAKKGRRKRKRREMAVVARMEEETRMNDPEEQIRLQADEEKEKERTERERIEFEERERVIKEAWAKKRAIEAEEEERRRVCEEEQSKQIEVGCGQEIEDECEYIEEGPPEIIWQGNEIIVRKKKVRVNKKDPDYQLKKEDPNRPTSNPLPPQSDAFSDYQSGSILSAQQILESVAQQTPNFGTEQDKAHCPFHLKTGACRFGSRCSRIHFYPDKSCTLLIKNMYNGPGLAWEQDEGLEYTDEEVEHSYEDFYEDVHTEFLKFGELVNFKVCRNGSPHLRGNVYVHYKMLDSAELAYHSVNGRYFGGKQLLCEYVGVIKWKVAICGEYMKSKLTTCSRGITCNFIHCFRNPGGDYEWADWDKPPPKYWMMKMASLFGYLDESGFCKEVGRGSPRLCRDSSRNSVDDTERYHSRRSQSREVDYSRSRRNCSDSPLQKRTHRLRCTSTDRKHSNLLDDQPCDKTSSSRQSYLKMQTSSNNDLERDCLDKELECRSDRRYNRNGKLESQDIQCDSKDVEATGFDTKLSDNEHNNLVHTERPRKRKSHRDKRRNEDEGCVSPKEHFTDEDKHFTTNQCTKNIAKRREKLHISPDDRWRKLTYDSNLDGNLLYEEWKINSSLTKSLRLDDCNDHGLQKSPSDSVLIDRENSRDQLGGEDIEVGRSNTSSFHFRCNSRKGSPKLEHALDHTTLKSRLSADWIDQDPDDRGRWEPDDSFVDPI